MEESRGRRRRRKFSQLADSSAGGSSSRRLKINNPPIDDVRSAGHALEDLPEELLHKVISSLTLKEAGRTSALSSRWRNRWIYYSNLCFDGASFDRFVDHVTTVLQRHSRVGVDRFELRPPAGLGPAHHHLVDRCWLGFVAKHVTLDLSPPTERTTDEHSFTRAMMGEEAETNMYRLPWPSSSSSIIASSVVSLLLGNMCLLQGLPAAASFRSLKKLELRFVLDLGGLTPMLSSCPALEWLSICESRTGHLVVPEQARCLRYLRLHGGVVDSIQLDATSLTTFEYTVGVVPPHHPFVPIKAHRAMKLAQAMVSLLEYYGDTLTYFWDHFSFCLAPVDCLFLSFRMDKKTTSWTTMNPARFIHLTRLTLHCCLSYGVPDNAFGILRLTRIIEAAPQLEHFVFHMDSNARPNILETADDQCIRPQVHHRLATVEMTGVVGLSGQLELAKYILLSAHALKWMTLAFLSRARYPEFSVPDSDYAYFKGLEKSATIYLDPQGLYRRVLIILDPRTYWLGIFEDTWRKHIARSS